jgi:hypothetical protein
MNHSIYSADRTTHIKIVAVALIAGIVFAGLGITLRGSAIFSQSLETASIVKPNKKPVMVTTSSTTAIR